MDGRNQMNQLIFLKKNSIKNYFELQYGLDFQRKQTHPNLEWKRSPMECV